MESRSIPSRRALAQGEPSEQALARLQALVSDELAQPLLVYGMKGERAVMTELLRRIRDDELSFSALSNGAAATWPERFERRQHALGKALV